MDKFPDDTEPIVEEGGGEERQQWSNPIEFLLRDVAFDLYNFSQLHNKFKRNGIKFAVYLTLQLHRHVRGPGERVAVPVHGLQERRRRLPHPVPRRPPLHRAAPLLHGVGGRAVQLKVS